MSKQILIFLIAFAIALQNEVQSEKKIDQDPPQKIPKENLSDFILQKYSQKFEEELLLDLIEIISKNKTQQEFTEENLIDFLNGFQEEVDRKLLEYYGIKNQEYIQKMKQDREKYGLTYNVYKLLYIQLINY